MKKNRFYKEEDGSWYIDLPNYPLAKANLAMICGADSLLDVLSKNTNEVYLAFSNDEIEGYDDILTRVNKNGLFGGATYFVENTYIKYSYQGENTLWLCPITIYVFGHYPKKIYFKVISDLD